MVLKPKTSTTLRVRPAPANPYLPCLPPTATLERRTSRSEQNDPAQDCMLHPQHSTLNPTGVQQAASGTCSNTNPATLNALPSTLDPSLPQSTIAVAARTCPPRLASTETTSGHPPHAAQCIAVMLLPAPEQIGCAEDKREKKQSEEQEQERGREARRSEKERKGGSEVRGTVGC